MLDVSIFLIYYHPIIIEQWLQDKNIQRTKQWIRERNGVAQTPTDVTLQTFIRNHIHHPENRQNTLYTEDELKQSIEEMIGLLSLP